MCIGQQLKRNPRNLDLVCLQYCIVPSGKSMRITSNYDWPRYVSTEHYGILGVNSWLNETLVLLFERLAIIWNTDCTWRRWRKETNVVCIEVFTYSNLNSTKIKKFYCVQIKKNDCIKKSIYKNLIKKYFFVEIG